MHDEVEAHGFKAHGRDDDGAPLGEDVEAHQVRSGRRNEDAPPEGVEREQAIPDADDDVEGHGARFNG